MTDFNWLSLLLLAIGVSLIAVEIYVFTFKLLVLGIAALLMSLACYIWAVPIWALVAFGVSATLVQISFARKYPQAAGIPAGDVVGESGFVTSVAIRDGVTHAVISFSKPFGGFEQWKIKQTEPLKNQCRAQVLKVNDDSTLTVEMEGETTQ